MLTDTNGTSYQLTGDTAKLSEHVGHEMKITGSKGSSTAAPGNGQPAGTTGTSSQQTLQVSSFKHISKTCQSGGMSHSVRNKAPQQDNTSPALRLGFS